jgi:hypothetical protein
MRPYKDDYMRRIALLGLLALLPGCDYAANPFVSFGGFIGDTHTIDRNPNRPVGNAENMLRVTGRNVNIPPLLPEPGNIWPGPQPPDPTLADIERQQNQEGQQPPSSIGGPLPGAPAQPTPNSPLPNSQPPQRQPRPVTRGSSSPPVPDQSVTPPVAQSAPNAPPSFAPSPRPPTVNTPNGAVPAYNGGNGITTYRTPSGTGIVVPNGNGTNTIVGPDGSVQTVPATR